MSARQPTGGSVKPTAQEGVKKFEPVMPSIDSRAAAHADDRRGVLSQPLAQRSTGGFDRNRESQVCALRQTGPGVAKHVTFRARQSLMRVSHPGFEES